MIRGIRISSHWVSEGPWTAGSGPTVEHQRLPEAVSAQAVQVTDREAGAEEEEPSAAQALAPPGPRQRAPLRRESQNQVRAVQEAAAVEVEAVEEVPEAGEEEGGETNVETGKPADVFFQVPYSARYQPFRRISATSLAW